MKWNFLNFHCLSEPHPTYNYTIFDFYSRPKLFKLMKKYASILSSDFIFARIDIYEIENEVK